MENGKKFRIEVKEHSAGGLFELEVTTKYYVIDNRNETILMQYESGYSAEFVAGTWANGTSGGIKEITISEDEKFVLISVYGTEEIEKVALPD